MYVCVDKYRTNTRHLRQKDISSCCTLGSGWVSTLGAWATHEIGKCSPPSYSTRFKVYLRSGSPLQASHGSLIHRLLSASRTQLLNYDRSDRIAPNIMVRMLERVCVSQDFSVRVRGPSPLHRQARMHLHHQLSSATWCCCPSPSYRPPYLSAAKRIFFGERTSSSWTHLQSSLRVGEHACSIVFHLRTFRLQPSPNHAVVLKVHPSTRGESGASSRER